MTCNDIDRFLIAERDGLLTSEAQAELSAHLSICAACRRSATTMRSILEGAVRLPSYAASPGFDAAVFAAATSAPLRRESGSRPRLIYFIAGAAASLLFVFAFGWLVGFTPEVQASTVLEEAIQNHQEAVLDFARSVKLLPGAKPDVE